MFFFHGGVHEVSIGWVPPSPHDSSSSSSQEGTRVDTVQAWCRGLALFHHHEMTSLLTACCHASSNSNSGDNKYNRNSPDSDGCSDGCRPAFSSVGGYHHPEPGSRLMQYGMGNLPDGSCNPTLIYDNFLSEGAPHPPSEAVISFLNSSGVVRTVTGHQPHGDVPVVISLPSLEVLTGDTSYARNVEWGLECFAESAALWEQLVSQRGEVIMQGEEVAETRGYAAAEIVIHYDQVRDRDRDLAAGEVCSKVLIHGVTESLFAYEFCTDNEFIGHCTADGWWVKSLLSLVSSGRGRGSSCGSCGDGEEKNPHRDDGAKAVVHVYMLSKSAGRDILNTFVTEETIRGLIVSN